MFFLVNMRNHSELGQRSLEDVVGIFGFQVRALGHTIVWDQRNDRFLNTLAGDGMNIVVEGFTAPSVEWLADAHGHGARFIILATEEPTYTGNPTDRSTWVGFNQGTQPEMVRRMFTFPDAAKFADGIIYLVPGDHVQRWYGQFCPAAYTELGYAPDLVNVRRKLEIEPTYDFGFYGSLTRRRMKILKKLTRYAGLSNLEKAVRLVADFKDQADRDLAMRQAKVIVQIRKFDQMGLVSSSRCNTALSLGRPVVAEPHLLSKPWDEIVTFAPTMESFYSQCLLARSAWRGIHAAQMEKFKMKLPPEKCAGEALCQIGVLERIAA